MVDTVPCMNIYTLAIMAYIFRYICIISKLSKFLAVNEPNTPIHDIFLKSTVLTTYEIKIFVSYSK